jgi:hypothetical protein
MREEAGVPPKPEPAQPKRPAYILWAALIDRIYDAFPLLCRSAEAKWA